MTLNISGGSLYSAGNLAISNVNGATTVANMTAGALTTGAGGQLFIGNNGVGVLNLSGGTMTVNNWLALAAPREPASAS